MATKANDGTGWDNRLGLAGQKNIKPIPERWESPTSLGAPAPTPAPALRPWFADPNAGWSYDSETMAGPPEAMGAVNLAALIRDKAKGLGYSGGGMWGDTVDSTSPGGDQSPVRSVNPDFQNWLTSNNYQLGGESVGINGIGGVNAFITDSTGKRISEQSYASDDSDFFNFGVGLLGLGAFSAVNAAAGLGAEAALPESQIGAMSGNPFLTTELSGLTAPTASELAAITPSIPSLNPFLATGISGLAGPTAAELAAITPAIPAAAGGAGLLSSLGGLKSILPAAGAIAGATGASGDQTQTTQNQIDPRMAAMLYGQGGFLGQAQDYFNSTKGGNALMNQGADAMKAAFTNPQAQQGFNAMQTQGMGLLGGGGQNDFLDAFKNRKTSAMPDLSQFKQPRGLLG